MSEKDNVSGNDFLFSDDEPLYFSGIAYVFDDEQVSHIEGAEEAFPHGCGASELPDYRRDEIEYVYLSITQKQLNIIETQRKELGIEWDACLARIIARGFSAVVADGLST